MRADLLLPDADPLTDIRNTRRIAAVIRAGRLYYAEALDALRADGLREADDIRRSGTMRYSEH
jgi:hypothetical protein